MSIIKAEEEKYYMDGGQENDWKKEWMHSEEVSRMQVLREFFLCAIWTKGKQNRINKAPVVAKTQWAGALCFSGEEEDAEKEKQI